jgi:tetratricopeptide (TPR) repeat protein
MSQVWIDHKDAANKALDAKDWDLASKEWQAAIEEAEKFAKGDGRLVTSIEGLAQVQFLKGNHAEAESLYKRALALRESAQGNDHQDIATVLNNLGAVYFKRGFYKDAMSHFERSLALRRKCFPAEHLEVGKSLYHLALVCHAEQRYDEADGHYRKSLDIKNKSLGNNHPDLINLLRNYAHLLRKTSRDSIASQMEQFASGIESKLKA